MNNRNEILKRKDISTMNSLELSLDSTSMENTVYLIIFVK